MEPMQEDELNIKTYPIGLKNIIENPNMDIEINKRRNLLLKEQIHTLDFNKIITLFDDLLNSLSQIKNPNKLLEIQKTLLNDTFHVKGTLLSMYNYFNNNLSNNDNIISNEYIYSPTLEIALNDNIKIQVRLKKVKKKLIDRMNVLINKCKIIVTNLHAYLEKIKNSDKYLLYFSNSINTKIYYIQSIFSDVSNNIINDNIINFNKCLTIDITQNNELEYISLLDLNGLTSKIEKFSKEKLDYNSLLNFKIPNDLFSLKVYYNQTQIQIDKDVSVYGLILNIYIKNDSSAKIELQSLFDYNRIIVNIYACKALFCDLKKNMVVEFQNFKLKLNKYYDLHLKNYIKSKTEILCVVDKETANKFTRSKCKLNDIKITNIISLMSNSMIVRNTVKLFGFFKEIIKIVCFYESEYKGISEYPGLKFKGKFLVDDGSFEAYAFINDMNIIKLIEWNKKEIDNIYERAKIERQFSIYEKYGYSGILCNKKLGHIYFNQFIIYGTPFAKINLKNANDDYEKYFQATFEGNAQKDYYAFINGEVEIDNYLSSKNKCRLIKRPYLKIVSIEKIE